MPDQNLESYEDLIQSLSSLVRLDPNSIEHIQLKRALTLQLAERKGVTAFLESDTISFLIDAIAAMGTYAQYSIDVAWGEGNIQTARLPESIRTIVRSLGVRQVRKKPASCTVILTRPPSNDELSIRSFTQFSTNDGLLFNREEIYFAPGEVQTTAVLHEGELINRSFQVAVSENSRVVIGEPGFSVSEDDIRVFFDFDRITVSKRPIWFWRNQFDSNFRPVLIHQVCADFTTADGRCELQFGNSTFARPPLLEETVRVVYANTKGIAGNSSIKVGEKVDISQELDFLDIEIILELNNGADEIPADTYREVGPLLFSAQNQAIDDSGYKAVSIQWSDTLDAIAIRQARYAPGRIEYANLIRMCLLTETPMTDARWNEFVEFLSDKSIPTAKYSRFDPTPFDVNIDATIFISPDADVNYIRNAAEIKIRQLLRLRYGILELNLYRSDIIETITNAAKSINYVDLHNPTTDIILSRENPRVISTTQGSGILTGSFKYYASYLSTVGESIPVNITRSITTSISLETEDGSVFFAFEESFKRDRIKIYRENVDSGEIVLLSTLQPNNLTYNDDGTEGVVVEKLPFLNDYGIFYPRLGNLNINVARTDRISLVARGVR